MLKAGDMGAEHLGQPIHLQMTLDLGTGQIRNVGGIGVEQAGGVDIDLPRVQTVDDDHIAALDGAFALGLETGKECRHSDKNEVGIGAEVGGIISLFGVDGGTGCGHFLGIGGHMIE